MAVPWWVTDSSSWRILEWPALAAARASRAPCRQDPSPSISTASPTHTALSSFAAILMASGGLYDARRSRSVGSWAPATRRLPRRPKLARNILLAGIEWKVSNGNVHVTTADAVSQRGIDGTVVSHILSLSKRPLGSVAAVQDFVFLKEHGLISEGASEHRWNRAVTRSS